MYACTPALAKKWVYVHCLLQKLPYSRIVFSNAVCVYISSHGTAYFEVWPMCLVLNVNSALEGTL